MGYNQNFIPLRYDTKRINEDVPIRQVLALYTDINTDTRGNVSCPSVSHIDKKPSAKIYDQHQGNNCHCFSCGRNYKPIDIVMEHKNATLPEACEMLINDFGLPMSHYSNIDEVERVNGAIKKGRFVDNFPLNRDDCAVLGYEKSAFSFEIDNLNYGYVDGEEEKIKLPSLSDLWNDNADNRRNIEAMLLGRCTEYKEMYTNCIQAETDRFKALYSLRTQGEWNEAKLIQKALDKNNIGTFSNVQLTIRQREMSNDIRELYEICENIDYYEARYRQVDAVEQKLINHQKERREQSKSHRWER